MPPSAKPLVLVVTSTLPRWDDDTEPRFVLDLCEALAGWYRIVVLAPHCRGAARHEHRHGIEIRRFRYFPDWGEVLAYDGGMLPKLRRRPWLWALVPVFLAAQVLATARLLRRESPVLVHAHWLIPQGVAVGLAQRLARRRVPIVCTAHGSDVTALRGPWARALQRWVARTSSRIGVVSLALGDELVRRGVDPTLIRVLPMGVAIPPAATALARDARLIAFAGRMVQGKGVELLLAALQRLSAGGSEVRLELAGGGPELDHFRRRAVALGLDRVVQFLGPVPQRRVQDLFARAAVAAMPSDAEGLGLVMLEAMAAGCPVVVTDLPAVRGVVRPGANGLVFPERDGPALAAALQAFLMDGAFASRLGDQGRKDVQECFSWPAVAEQHHRVYREVMPK